MTNLNSLSKQATGKASQKHTFCSDWAELPNRCCGEACGLVSKPFRFIVRFIAVILTISSSLALATPIPGFVVAEFSGTDFNDKDDIWVNAIAHETYPSKIYATGIPEHTTIGYGSYMFLEGGVVYDFKGCYDDYVSVKIDGTTVLPKGSGCKEVSGSYTPQQTGWYRAEFRVGNGGGDGGCCKESEYGILWKRRSEMLWQKVEDAGEGTLFRAWQDDWSQIKTANTIPVVISSQMRASDSTIMDIEYIVFAKKEVVNTRALAFEDGERSFLKVVRPESFVDDTQNNIGDSIAANVPHKLSWKVSKDWKSDLAKVRFEILASEQGKLPMCTIDIPATDKSPFLRVVYNSPTKEDVLNALLWYYADHDPHLRNDNGYLYSTELSSTGDLLFKWSDPVHMGYAAKFVYNKMGYEALSGEILSFARYATRKSLKFNTEIQNAYLKQGLAGTIPVETNGYCVIDLLSMDESGNYKVSYLSAVSVDGWGDEYKTTKILLRRIDRGTHNNVTFTKPFYVGVFEVTQKQYELVIGENPSKFKGDARPVENITWNTIRGDSSVYNWPTSRDVAPNSFVGILRKHTDLPVDLPTEAQWEYCRDAGEVGPYYNDGASAENDLDLIGRYELNTMDGRGGYEEHTTVGSYMPNSWGLYDMQGNVYEWCLDWHSERTSDPIKDPVGALSGNDRALRGGRYKHWNWYRYSDFKDYASPTYKDGWVGFRLAFVSEK